MNTKAQKVLFSVLMKSFFRAVTGAYVMFIGARAVQFSTEIGGLWWLLLFVTGVYVFVIGAFIAISAWTVVEAAVEKATKAPSANNEPQQKSE